MSSNEKYNYFCMFTPEGKVLPVESVIRSTEHGGVCVALRNEKTGVLIAQNTGKSDLFAEKRTKIKQLDSHLVYTYSGITNDGAKFGEAIKRKLQREKHRTGAVLPISCLIEDEQFYSGLEVMRYGNRATGISVILLGIEKGKVCLVEMNPTGEALPTIGTSIGSRAQSARTILDSKGAEILSLSEEGLLSLGMEAFRNAVNNEEVMENKYYSVVVLSAEEGVKWMPSTV
ncbi:20S proteasome subunit alpha 6 [Nematocida sp. AWRm77]|nr:20S proteasome subunit alpha 6 [Nematocida sp. AWRm77]